MSKYLKQSMRHILKPFLINLVGLKSLQNFHPKLECESLVYENDEKSLNISEVNDEYRRQFRDPFSPLQHLLNPIHKIDSVLSQDAFRPYVDEFPNIMDDHEDIINASDVIKRRLNRVYKIHQVSSDGVNEGCFAAAVSINGQMVFKQAYRNQDVDDSVEASIDMVGPIGNVTKVFTSLMILKLIQEGKLSLDTNVHEVLGSRLPPIRLAQDLNGLYQGQQVSIGQLLQHSSGIKTEESRFEVIANLVDTNTRDQGDYGFSNFSGFITTFIRLNGLEFVPGTKSIESNYGYQLLAIIYEAVTKQNFIEDVKDELAKMGLYDTDFIENDHLALDAKRPKSNWIRLFSPQSHIIRGNRSSEHGFGYGRACYGMCSTLSDLVKYGNIMAQCITNDDNLPIEPLQHQTASSIFTQLDPDPAFFRLSQNPFAREIKQSSTVLGWNIFRYYNDFQNTPNNRPEIQALYKSTRKKEGEAGLMILFDKSNGASVNDPDDVKQISPLMYPLGETIADHDGDIIVGAILCDSKDFGSVEDLIFDIIQTLYLEHKKYSIL